MTEPPDQLAAFRTYVRAFIEREVAPNAQQWTAQRSVPRALHEAAGAAGLYRLKYPVALGGLARPYEFTRVMLDEFGRSGWMGCLLGLVLQSEFATPHLAIYGSPALQQRYLVPAMDGTCITAIAMTEPEGGSDSGEPAHHGDRRRRWLPGDGTQMDDRQRIARGRVLRRVPGARDRRRRLAESLDAPRGGHQSRAGGRAPARQDRLARDAEL